MARIAILVSERAHMTGVAALLDTLDLVNRYAVRQYGDRETLPAAVSVRLLSANGRPVRMSNGRDLQVDDGLQGNEAWDLVYAAPFEIGKEFDLDAALANTGAACDWLRRQRASGALMAASGTGLLLLAEAGVLGDQTVTAPWWLEKAFRRRFPAARIDTARMICEGDRFLCAGPSAAEPALAHRILERLLSPNVANWVAKITLVDPYPDGPEPWTVFSPRVLREDSLVGRAQHWLQVRFTQKPRLADLAAALSVSERTLARRFERSLGMSPHDYLQTLRVEAAKQMLRRSDRRIDRIGYLVGYADPGFFKQVFKARTGLSPSQYRKESREA